METITYIAIGFIVVLSLYAFNTATGHPMFVEGNYDPDMDTQDWEPNSYDSSQTVSETPVDAEPPEQTYDYNDNT